MEKKTSNIKSILKEIDESQKCIEIDKIRLLFEKEINQSEINTFFKSDGVKILLDTLKKSQKIGNYVNIVSKFFI